MGGTECGSERVEIGFERGRCVRRSGRASWPARSEQTVGIRKLRNEALERHSEALHIGRCEGRAVWHERDVSNIRLAVSAVNLDQTSTIAQRPDSSGAQAASTSAGRAGRTVEAQRRALMPPSTA